MYREFEWRTFAKVEVYRVKVTDRSVTEFAVFATYQRLKMML